MKVFSASRFVWVKYPIFCQVIKVDFSEWKAKPSFDNTKIIFEILSEQELCLVHGD